MKIKNVERKKKIVNLINKTVWKCTDFLDRCCPVKSACRLIIDSEDEKDYPIIESCLVHKEDDSNWVMEN